MANYRYEISGFEKVLFGFTRLVAVLAALGAVAGIVICSLALTGRFDKSTDVSYSEIASEISSEQASDNKKSGSDDGTKTDYTIPSNLEVYMSERNRTILDGWLSTLESDGQRQDFLDNLSQVVDDAKLSDADPAAVMNTYKNLKVTKLSESALDEYAEAAAKGAAAAAILGFVFLLILVSLMLVLLAIERHTRVSPAFSRAEGA